MSEKPQNGDQGSFIERKYAWHEHNTPQTQRDWESYPYLLALKDKEASFWKGKEILDVGSAIKYSDPEYTFPGATVRAIDPHFENIYNSAHEVRTGIAQDIPYEDNKFDLVVSSHAVPQHVFPRDVPECIAEMLRVMKPTGEIRMSPCVEDSDITSEIRRNLENSGFEVNFLERELNGKKSVTVIKAREDMAKKPTLKDDGVHSFKKWVEEYLSASN